MQFKILSAVLLFLVSQGTDAAPGTIGDTSKRVAGFCTSSCNSRGQCTLFTNVNLH